MPSALKQVLPKLRKDESPAARIVLVFGALVALGVVAATGYEIFDQRRDTYAQAERELVAFNVALAAHTEGVVAAADIVLSDVAHELSRGNVAAMAPAALRSHLHGHTSGMPMVAHMLVADAAGRVLAHSRHEVPPGTSVADRPFFGDLRAQPDRLAIGTPIVGRISGLRLINLARALVDARGNFAGAVVIGLETTYFVDFFRSTMTYAGGAAALFRSDAWLLARYPEQEDAYGRPWAGADLFRLHLPHAAEGLYRATSVIDGKPRLSGFRRLPRYPLVLLVSVEEGKLLENWRIAAWRMSAVGLTGLGLVLLLLTVILRQLRFEAGQAARLTASEEQFRQLVERAGDALYLHDLDGRILLVNQQGCDSLGYACTELVGRSVADLVPEADFARQCSLWPALQSEVPLTLETTNRRKDGSVFPVEVRLSAFEMAGRPLVLALARDISERRALQIELEHRAHHDPLTGLPNRLLLQDRLRQAIIAARRNNRVLALLFIDLDDFKQVNDGLGHAAGDALLIEAGRRIGATLRQTDTVARYGGDEFVVLLPDLEHPENGQRVADKIVAAFMAPFLLDGGEATATASIGLALFPLHGGDEEALLHAADHALYRAKEAGRNRCVVATVS